MDYKAITLTGTEKLKDYELLGISHQSVMMINRKTKQIKTYDRMDLKELRPN